MKMTPRDWTWVSITAVVAVASFLDWVSPNSAWSNQFAPTVYVVHLPLIASGVFIALRSAGVIRKPVGGIPDDALLRIVSTLALVGAATGVWFQFDLADRYCNVSSLACSSVGLGGILTVAGALALAAVAWFGHRLPALQNGYHQVTSAAAGSSSPFTPRWIALVSQYQVPGGPLLNTGVWYLVVGEQGGYLIVDTNDGSTVHLPRELEVGH